MDKEQAKALAVKHGPTAGIAVVAVAAIALMQPDAPRTPTVPPLPPEVTKAEAHPRRTSDPTVHARVVSCGNSKVASVIGDDFAGVATPGPGAGGKCVVLFARSWDVAPTCSVNGGKIVKVTTTDLVLTGIGDAVAYRCQEKETK